MTFSILIEFEQYEKRHRSLGLYLIKKIHHEEEEKFNELRDKLLAMQTATIFQLEAQKKERKEEEKQYPTDCLNPRAR